MWLPCGDAITDAVRNRNKRNDARICQMRTSLMPIELVRRVTVSPFLDAPTVVCRGLALTIITGCSRLGTDGAMKVAETENAVLAVLTGIG